MGKKSILFTNLYMISRTGSELHVFELAKKYVKEGWEVTIYTLVMGYPMQGLIASHGIKLVEFGNEQSLNARYDVLYAQHNLISDYLFYSNKIAFEKVIISVLGLGDLEALPYLSSNADLFVFISEEARDFAIKENGDLKSQVFLFPNYATDEYFDAFHRASDGQHELRKIAVISNHVPSEVMELENVIPDEIEVSFFGVESESVEVSPDFLSSFDLVISIGRTIQACFATGIPCYCYDRFGGPGYISIDEIDEHAYSNFSGRSCEKKLSAEELWQDISENYKDASRSLEVLHDLALERWSFEKLFDSIFKEIDSLKVKVKEESFRYLKPRTLYNLTILCRLYQQSIVEHTGLAQFYWIVNGKELSEENSLKVRYYLNTWIDCGNISELKPEYRITRFDPDEKPCMVSIEETKTGLGKRIKGLSDFKFLSFDPQIYLDKQNITEIKDISFFVSPINEIEANIALSSELELAHQTIDHYSTIFKEESDGQKSSYSIKWLLRTLAKEIKSRLIK